MEQKNGKRGNKMKEQILMFILWSVIMIIRTICLIIITKCIWYDYKASKKDQELWENREKWFESEVEE